MRGTPTPRAPRQVAARQAIARRITTLACVAVPLAGCTFQPGVAFGTLTGATLDVRFQPPASRLDELGRLKTDTGYRVTLDMLRLVPRTLDFQTTSGSAGSGGSFDPANPPPGYSLCHGGHCHRDDGALVAYEDIEAELSGGTLKTVTALSLPVKTGFDLIPGPAASASLTDCQPGCELDRGTWSKAVLDLATISASGSVEDPTSFNRLGGQVRPWSFSFSPDAFSQKVDVRIDRDQGERLAVVATFALTEKLFDQIDFQALANATTSPLVLDASNATPNQLAENLAQSRLAVTVIR